MKKCLKLMKCPIKIAYFVWKVSWAELNYYIIFYFKSETVCSVWIFVVS